ncbi:MAG: DUF1016 domain-containing protein [Flavobacteriales bacterium]|nr:DUF1016 domain-containing protein [Flavobacteriales bacterium]
MSKELATNKDYIEWLGEIKSQIQHSQQRAALKVNQELLGLYWFIGGALNQKQAEWGDKFIENLARDLKVEFPDMKGFSKRNLEQMRRWFDFHSAHFEIAQQAVAQLKFDTNLLIAQQAVAQLPEKSQQAVDQNFGALIFSIPWGHHLYILTKVKAPEEVYFYIIKTIQNGWSRSILEQQIESDLYNRQGKALSNFELTLPDAQADLAQETIKNPYNFDFLTLAEDVKERDFERALIQHIKKFLLELGKGFAYVGNQFNLNVEGDDFFLDLLFFNTNLNCYVIFELKVGDFKPEFAGKLNMYVNTVNAQVKADHHAETIGVLLCKTPNKTVIEYSIKGIASPLGVSDYSFKTALPEELKADMPTVEELEEELAAEIEVKKSPLEEKRDKLLALIKSSGKEEVKIPVNPDRISQVIENVFIPLIEKLEEKIGEHDIHECYVNHRTSFRVDNQGHERLDEFYKLLKENNSPREIEFDLYFRGFKKAGTKAFDNGLRFNIQFSDFKYTILLNRNNQKNKEFLYSHEIKKEELDELAEQMVNELMDEILICAERNLKMDGNE